jgi:DNA repair protein RecO (recombination protein O)
VTATRVQSFDDVLVCSVVPYRDHDAVVRLFTRSHGRVGAFARGAQKSRKRFPALSAPGIGRASLKTRSGDLMELVELDPDPCVLGLAADLRALGHASYVVELCERLLPEADPAADVFELARTAVVGIAARGADAVLLRAFELKLLHRTGHLPDLATDDGGRCRAYDPLSGRFLSADGTGGAPMGALPFSDEARRAAVELLHASLDALPVLEPAIAREAGRLFASHLRHIGGPPLRSVAWLASL